MFRAKNCQSRPVFHGAIQKTESGFTAAGPPCNMRVNYGLEFFGRNRLAVIAHCPVRQRLNSV